MRHPFPQAPAPGDKPSSTRRLRIALGTWVAIEARGGDSSATAETRAAAELTAIEAAYAAIHDIDIRMHPRRDGSEIARINSTRPGTPVEVQPDTWRLLQLARRLYDLTDGIFDPCLPTRPGRLDDIEIQPHTPVLICHAPVELDLGGIAKGHAIDHAVEKLQKLGCTSGLVNAGGDLRVFGDRAETLFLRQRGNDNAEFRPISLKNAALAVSDLDATNRPAEHQGCYIRGRDLITQQAIAASKTPTPRYAAVIGSTAAIADALTKCVLLCPPDQGKHVLEQLQARSASLSP
jgi:FAD:protein FMN transferase